MKKLFVLLAFVSLNFSLSREAEAKSCEGSTNESCVVQFFCAEVSPFLIPVEVEVWNTAGSLSLHKFVVRSDDTRTEVGAAEVRETNLSSKVIYLSSGFPKYQLEVDIHDGDSKFSEDFMGRTLMTPLLCLQPVEL